MAIMKIAGKLKIDKINRGIPDKELAISFIPMLLNSPTVE